MLILKRLTSRSSRSLADMTGASAHGRPRGGPIGGPGEPEAGAFHPVRFASSGLFPEAPHPSSRIPKISCLRRLPDGIHFT